MVLIQVEPCEEVSGEKGAGHRLAHPADDLAPPEEWQECLNTEPLELQLCLLFPMRFRVDYIPVHGRIPLGVSRASTGRFSRNRQAIRQAHDRLPPTRCMTGLCLVADRISCLTKRSVRLETISCPRSLRSPPRGVGSPKAF